MTVRLHPRCAYWAMLMRIHIQLKPANVPFPVSSHYWRSCTTRAYVNSSNLIATHPFWYLDAKVQPMRKFTKTSCIVTATTNYASGQHNSHSAPPGFLPRRIWRSAATHTAVDVHCTDGCNALVYRSRSALLFRFFNTVLAKSDTAMVSLGTTKW